MTVPTSGRVARSISRWHGGAAWPDWPRLTVTLDRDLARINIEMMADGQRLAIGSSPSTALASRPPAFLHAIYFH
jgi:hypothetical protein